MVVSHIGQSCLKPDSPQRIFSQTALSQKNWSLHNKFLFFVGVYDYTSLQISLFCIFTGLVDS